MENYELGNLIKERRMTLGLSLEQVGNACGVYRSTVMRWENGRTKDIKRSHIEVLSKLLYIPIPVLLGVEDIELESADIVLKRNEIVKKLNEIKDLSKLENIKKYIEVFC